MFMEAAPDHRLSPEDTFEDTVRIVDQFAVEYLTVLDEKRCLVGIVTRNELFDAFAQGRKPSITVREFMRADPVAVTPDEMSVMAGDLMNKHDLDWLPVVESKDARCLIGIVRSEKMLRWLVEQF